MEFGGGLMIFIVFKLNLYWFDCKTTLQSLVSEYWLLVKWHRVLSSLLVPQGGVDLIFLVACCPLAGLWRLLPAILLTFRLPRPRAARCTCGVSAGGSQWFSHILPTFPAQMMYLLAFLPQL